MQIKLFFVNEAGCKINTSSFDCIKNVYENFFYTLKELNSQERRKNTSCFF